jgi:hypothetical protein
MSQFPQQDPFSAGSGFGGYSKPPAQGSGNSGGNKVVMIILIVLGAVFGMGVLIIGVLVALLLPAVGAARDAARRMADSNSMRQVSLAILNYESAYKRLPPPEVTNSQGEKVWSWRVALLPFVEEVGLYQSIDFMDMQPWNSPKNKFMQGESPRVFQSLRANHPRGSQACNVFVISAPQPAKVVPAFVEGEQARIGDFEDGLANTIVAIMLVKHSTEWANPANLTIDEAYKYIQQEDKIVLAAFADGSIHPLPVTIDRATFEAMVTRNGGEVVRLPE